MILIANPLAKSLRARPARIEHLKRLLLPGDRLQMPQTPAALDAAVAQVRPDETVAIYGGDGTLHRVLTALYAQKKRNPVLVLPGGTMNTIDRGLGGRGPATRRLGDFQQARRQSTALGTTTRWPLRVDGANVGFLFGVGITARFIEAYEAGGTPSPTKAATTLLRAMGGSLVGGAFARAFFAPIPLTLTVDGKVWAQDGWRLIAVGATEEIGLGFAPFSGVATHPGHFHVVGTGSRPRTILRELKAFYRGQTPATAHGGPGTQLTLQHPTPLTYQLDGDLYQAREGTLTVEVAQELTLWKTPGHRDTPLLDGPVRVPKD